jgi:transposase, IS5 family
MIREPNPRQLSFEEFKTPFEKGLDESNRWIILADNLPWEKLATIYTQSLNKKMGRPAKSTKMVVGAMIIKHKMSLSDEETTRTIQENPYHQFFLGYQEFSHDGPFDPSLFVTIRKRLGQKEFDAMTEAFLVEVEAIESPTDMDDEWTQKTDAPDSLQSSDEKTKSVTPPENTPKNSGSLLIDATVSPADIKYPTDLDLLNISREHSERLIDILWKLNPVGVKPRTYRRKARQDYLSLSKKRRKKSKEIRKGIRKQLNYLWRNIKTINKLLDKRKEQPIPFACRDLRLFWIIQEVHRQQREMYDSRTHSTKDRIVSVSQPHVRPIVRGKAGTNVEFGAKLSVSLWNGYAFLDRVSWDNFNESGDLTGQVKSYMARFGCWPEFVRADQIYGTRENRTFLDSKNICYTFKPLGRPKKKRAPETAAERKKYRAEAGLRNPIEGKFGEGKRRYNLDLVKAKLPDTSESWIATVFFVMNLSRWLREYFFVLFSRGLFAPLSRPFDYFKKRWMHLLAPGCL